ncbi:hypothetical protein DY023_00340 [Microbacterium bovistercoris]|uniref:NodB homology domain-containing protein n=1 Tax=Microbacterium bovistercoris TaxID=2293570 RepID=A0A371NYQ9_9MICO|nr:polysaccharide deacetylase family protein [Microbacterium bovistercoris]REJ08724.1 hypothetical protein DY023_00340 [Microbacterium bovistercoris]
MSGRLLLTFDDRHVASWVAARPLFDRVGATVTFFVVEADLLDAGEQRGIRTLLADGHSVGSHGLRHLDADAAIADLGTEEYLRAEITPSVEALSALGARGRSFAYPNSRRDDVSDAVLGQLFDWMRAGSARTGDMDVAARTIMSRPTPVLPSRGMDTGRGEQAHLADTDVLSSLLRATAEQDATLVLYAHDIAARSQANHIHPDRLAAVLAEADDLGLQMHGLDRLPLPESARS